jgi:hypothetical protein
MNAVFSSHSALIDALAREGAASDHEVQFHPAWHQLMRRRAD